MAWNRKPLSSLSRVCLDKSRFDPRACFIVYWFMSHDNFLFHKREQVKQSNSYNVLIIWFARMGLGENPYVVLETFLKGFKMRPLVYSIRGSVHPSITIINKIKTCYRPYTSVVEQMVNLTFCFYCTFFHAFTSEGRFA